MPIKIIEGLPAAKELAKEGIHTIEDFRAQTQDIRPLRLLMINLMPLKETTELQFLRLLGNSPLQVELDFCRMKGHVAKNASVHHLNKYYTTFEEIKDQKYDGLIVTGAPVELLDFNAVDYIDELRAILEWSKDNVYSSIFICWGAQMALHHFYEVEKTTLDKKLFGVYPICPLEFPNPLLRGLDDYYYTCQSRHTSIDLEKLQTVKDLKIIASNPEIGPDMIASHDYRQIFILGHMEYDRMTLANEYHRDLQKKLPIDIPKNYFPENDPTKRPEFIWRSSSYIFYNNWLNMVYQDTPYDLNRLKELK